jgi:hypothetical protein
MARTMAASVYLVRGITVSPRLPLARRTEGQNASPGRRWVAARSGPAGARAAEVRLPPAIVLIVTRLERLARSTRDLVDVLPSISESGAEQLISDIFGAAIARCRGAKRTAK